MKNIFKKIAVIALVMIMCVSSIVPSISAAETTCPGKDYTHTAANCSYTVVAKTEAACLVAGIVTGQCNSCGKRFVAESVEAPGHDWDVVAASCTKPITKTCKVCGTVEKATEAAGHTYGEWVVTSGVCKPGEKRTRTCTVCDYVETNIMQENHSWVVTDYTEPEYCTQAGVAVYTCENKGCGETKTAKLYATTSSAKHDFVAWDVDTMGADPYGVAATCAKTGVLTKVCTVCEVTKTEFIAKKKHVASDLRFVDEVVESLGCNGTGTKAYGQCFDCGERYLAVSTGVTPVYAKKLTTYPTFTTLPEGANADDYYVVYNDYDYTSKNGDGSIKKDEAGNIIYSYSSDAAKTADLVRDEIKHDPYDTYVAESCIADGYYSIHCTKCGFDESKVLPATGHVYYTDVESSAEQTAYMKAHKAQIKANWIAKYKADNPSKTDSQAETAYNSATIKWSDIAPNSTYGKNVTWSVKHDPTCEKEAYVDEICLNTHVTEAHYKDATKAETVANNTVFCQDDTNITEDNTKEYILTGKDEYKALGHQFSTTATKDTASYVGVPYETCTASGVWIITCGRDNCNVTKTQNVAAKGHKWEKVSSISNGAITTYAATCQADGLQCYKCSRSGCGEEKSEVIVKTGEDHAWAYIPTGDFTSSDAVADKVASLNCSQTLEVVRYCTVPECAAGNNPVAYTAKGKDHKYYDTENADNYKKIVKLEKPGTGDAKSKIMKDSTSTIVAVEYLVAGDCTRVASYRLNCLNGCGMFKSFEISEGFNSGAHQVILTAPVRYNNDGKGFETTKSLCDQGTVDAPAMYNTGFWVCGVKTCPYYKAAKNNVRDKGTFKVYSSHLNPETGKAITYKDVPDANISGAASLAEAMNVKAPVDENGNTIYAIDIPGTSLVWMYVADVSCYNDQVILGGLYCPDCKNDKLVLTDTANQGKVAIGMTRSAYHTSGTRTTTITATCQTYGYKETKCIYCDFVLQENYFEVAAHDYISANAVVTTVNANCEKDGYSIKKCGLCREIETVIIPATGHRNAAGDLLTTSCLDNNAIDRKCDVCTKVVIGDHLYGADDKCTRCGVSK